MTLVQGAIVCVAGGTVVVAIVGYLVDRATARREAANGVTESNRRGK
jgi:hypothetical protein